MKSVVIVANMNQNTTGCTDSIGCKQFLSRSNIEGIDCYTCKGNLKTQDLKITPIIMSVS
jgi:hypothetical protein